MTKQLIEAYASQAESLHGILAGMDDIRTSAMSSFQEQGFPGTKNEEWRYSDMRAFHKKHFDLVSGKSGIAIPEPLGDCCARFVFINGRYDEESSDIGQVWKDISIRPLANHFMANESRVDELVKGSDSVSLLNTALMRDGLVLSIPSNVGIGRPIEILHVMDGSDNAAAHVRHVIEMGEGSSAAIIERFVGDDSAYWTNSVLQARITENAKLRHIRVQEEGANALHTAKAYVNLGGGSEYICTNVALGGAMSRFDANVRILMDGAKATVNGVALAATGQSHDMHTHVSHLSGNAVSEQVFRTIADSRGTTSFQGKVTVVEDAQRTLANQSFKALIFDKTAQANAKPELEILADDVKCSHGATVGQLDDKAIFYLTSRGIDPETARQMLVSAFVAEALGKVDFDDVKTSLMGRIASWMLARSNDKGTGG